MFNGLPERIVDFSALFKNEIIVNQGGLCLKGNSAYVFYGTTAGYTATLPPVSGNRKKVISIRMANALTQVVTIAGNQGELIDGLNTRIMWANESALLYCDGATWTKIGGKSIPMSSSLVLNGPLLPTANTWTLATNFATSSFLKAPSAFQDLANNKFVIQRPGYYYVGLMASVAPNTNVVVIGVEVRKNAGTEFLKGITVTNNIAQTIFPLNNIFSLIAGDYLRPYIYYASGTFAPSNSMLNDDSGSPCQNFFTVTEVPSW